MTSFIWGAGSSVGALATSITQKVIVYAERRRMLNDPSVFVYHLEMNTIVATLACEGELGIAFIDVCRDEPRAVILGDIPDHNIILWDWSRNTVLATASARHSRAAAVTFNPLNPRALCSCGSKVELWELVFAEGSEQLVADPVVSLDRYPICCTALPVPAKTTCPARRRLRGIRTQPLPPLPTPPPPRRVRSRCAGAPCALRASVRPPEPPPHPRRATGPGRPPPCVSCPHLRPPHPPLPLQPSESPPRRPPPSRTPLRGLLDCGCS